VPARPAPTARTCGPRRLGSARWPRRRSLAKGVTGSAEQVKRPRPRSRRYKHNQVRTSGGVVTEGQRYAYEEGPYRFDVVLLEDLSTRTAIQFRLQPSGKGGCPPSVNRGFTAIAFRRYADLAYSGMWRLMDLPPRRRARVR